GPTTTIKFGIREDPAYFYLDDVSFNPAAGGPDRGASPNAAGLFIGSSGSPLPSRTNVSPTSFGPKDALAPGKLELPSVTPVSRAGAAPSSGRAPRSTAAVDSVFLSSHGANVWESEHVGDGSDLD